MIDFLLLLMGAGLVSNLVLEYLLGTDAVLALSRSRRTAQSLALAMLIFAPVAAVLAFWVEGLLSGPAGLAYLRLPVLVLLLVGVLAGGHWLLARLRPDLDERIRPLMPLLLTNGGLLGAVLLTLMQVRSPGHALLLGLGTGAGLALVAVAFAAIRRRLATADIPAPFRGVAIQLIALGLFSMAFMGFTGI